VPTVRHADYTGAWLEVLREDNRAIMRAASQASKAADGMFEVPAGGRRYRALELLVMQKRMAKTQPVPCVVREGGIAEDDSLAEK
jgi:ParB family transcriptional regulator, chromosome partitioning protein